MKYRTMAADPPWPYNDRLGMSDTPRSAEANYDTMTVQQICELRGTDFSGSVAGFEFEPDAFLWLWTTNPFLLNGAAAAVCTAWGFVPKQLITWVKGKLVIEDEPSGTMWPELKMPMGMGRYTRGVTEHLILATRGKAASHVQARNQRNVLLWPEEEVLVAARGPHSVKPESAYKLIEDVCPGPYVELFARRPRPGWTTWGKEAPQV